MTANRLPHLKSSVLASLAMGLGACGGGGGGAPPAAPAVIDAGNAATITREVLDAGLGAGSFGAVVAGGGILSADGGANARTLGALMLGTLTLGTLTLDRARQRKTSQQAQPSVVIPPEPFDCLVSGTVRLSGSLASVDTLTAGDRISADFNDCDDAEGSLLDGGLRIDVTAFSGDIFSDQFLLGASVTVTVTDLTITEDGESVTGSGAFDMDLDLTVPLVSDLTVAGELLEVSSGSDSWVLRDFAVTVIEDGRGIDLLFPVTRYAGTGTLEGADFEGAVDFVTVEPFLALDDGYPGSGEVLITGANGATIRATVFDAQMILLAIDLDGNNVVDETQQMAWSTVGPLGAVFHRVGPGPVLLP